MRIGNFAKQHHTTIDAIRHYMELSLIVPEKKGGQYDFDTACQRDMEDLISLKDLGFSLNEIKALFLIRRLSKLTAVDRQYMIELLQVKYEELDEQIKRLQTRKEQIGVRLNELHEMPQPSSFNMGMEIGCLPLLSCPECGNRLKLSEAVVQDDQIMEGILSCSCGKSYALENGILMVQDDKAGSLNAVHVNEYIKETDSNFLDKLCSTMAWTQSRMQSMDLNGKMILELGPGHGLFLRSIYDILPDDSIYFAVDHDVERIKLLKGMLEKSGLRRKVVFICADFLKIPLKPQSVDVLVDISGTSNYGFEHEAFLPPLIDGLLKRQALLVGSYIVFKHFGIDTVIGPAFRKNFMEVEIAKGLEALGFIKQESFSSKSVEEGGKYENYIQKGEQVYTYLLIAERWG